MKTDIEYARDIVVAVTYQRRFSWYASEKEFWILDQSKWSQFFRDAGIKVSGNYEDRFGIAIVNEANAGVFLEHIAPDRVTASHLQTLLGQYDLSDFDSFSHLMPSLFIDFDSKVVISYYSEPTAFEKFAPDSWTSAYRPFFDLIPLDERYWKIDSLDLLSAYGSGDPSKPR